MNELSLRKPCVLHLRSSEFFGGPERAILGQCAAMRDFDFVCGCFQHSGQVPVFLERAEELGVATEGIEQAKPWDYRVANRLREVVAKKGIDLVVSHDYKATFFAMLALRGLSVGHIRHFRGATAEDVKVRFYNSIDRFVMRRLPRILVVSEGTRRTLEGYGVDSRCIEVVPNAIEDHKLVPPTFTRDARRSGGIRIVAAGRLSFEKGYDVLLDALIWLRENAGDFTVEIFGHGPEQERLERIVRRGQLGSQVRFKGFVGDILPVLRKADLLVLPSRSEGMPNVILEAWAQKLAVVATAVGGVPEMIEDGVSGLLARPEDSVGLARQLQRMMSDSSLAISCGEAGYARVCEQYNYRVQAALLRRVYAEALAATPDTGA